jgi:hypothetical protein
MYHNYRATKRHNKVYALLGLCSDSIKAAGLDPNYSLPWECLMRRLVKFLLGDLVSVTTWNDVEVVVIKSKGCITGQVVEVKNASDGRQSLKVTLRTSRRADFRTVHLLLQTSAKWIQSGDMICLLQPCSKPTIIRLCKDYFAMIVVAALPMKVQRTEYSRYEEHSDDMEFTILGPGHVEFTP